MKAARIHNFGGPEVIVFEDVPRPMPGVAPTGTVVLLTDEHGTELANQCIPINSAFAIAPTTSQPMLLS
jgi:hypothetical protein